MKKEIRELNAPTIELIADILDKHVDAILGEVRIRFKQIKADQSSEPAQPVKVPSDDQWQTLIGWLDRRRHYPTVQIEGKVAGDVADRLRRAENERAAMDEWIEKTEFLQRLIQNGTLPIRHLGRHRADIARDTINQMAITLGKMAAGYRPGDEGWTQEDDEMLRLAMSVEVSDE